MAFKKNSHQGIFDYDENHDCRHVIHGSRWSMMSNCSIAPQHLLLVGPWWWAQAVQPEWCSLWVLHPVQEHHPTPLVPENSQVSQFFPLVIFLQSQFCVLLY